jgi:hypothetical protein
MTDDRLYGPEGAEELHFDLEEVLDEVWEESGTLVVYEHTVHPPEYHLPKVETIVELVLEWTAEFGEVTEGWEASNPFTPAVLAAASALRQAIGSTITHRMANKHVATWDVTWVTNPDCSIEHTAVRR